MPKTIKRFVSKNTKRFVSRRTTGRFVPRRTKHRIMKGVIYVRASFRNTIVTVTDTQGQAVSWSSAGACGFKGTKRRSPFAAQTAAENVLFTLTDQGLLKQAEVLISGPGPGRDTALRAIARSGVILSYVRDITPMPHNGCRPPKKRRV
jgi:small subunit ribosomal protein S11|uniref:Small ribosomal subunit protein uS11c n=1 Tax=Taxus brevifolia TaxID=46220 RepID=A0A481X9K5_TAXBR|nr:ribosomal protein S11 [Taxus brevifolia]QBK34167.1 ribosomal protein S11 [Taxus brevifolia]QBK34331.1 ribosomal protein S11 [Taxus brevifolia]QBK36380.1 ribosomal protein S11 [Taxus brevifolia]